MENKVIVPSKSTFSEMLKRGNIEILSDRAQAIVEDTELMFKRKVEDLQLQLKRLNRDRYKHLFGAI